MGIEPTDAARYEALKAIALPEPVEPLGRRLDMSRDDFQQRIREVASFRAARLEAERYVHVEGERLNRELRQSMYDEVDDYITALRPAFDSAIADFQKIIDPDLGLTTASGPEDAMALGPKTVEAWMRMAGPKGTSRALDSIAGLRIRMSTAAGVQPCNTEPGGRFIRVHASAEAGPSTG